jgi:hypothetical protein
MLRRGRIGIHRATRLDPVTLPMLFHHSRDSSRSEHTLGVENRFHVDVEGF